MDEEITETWNEPDALRSPLASSCDQRARASAADDDGEWEDLLFAGEAGMALTRVVALKLILTNTVLFGAIISLLTFVNIDFARFALPTVVTQTLASIEVVDALPVLTANVLAQVRERAIVDLDMFDLFDFDLVRARVVVDERFVVERHVEIRPEKNVLQATAKAVADEDLHWMIVDEDLLEADVDRVGVKTIDRQR